jgi:transmembrane sensor
VWERANRLQALGHAARAASRTSRPWRALSAILRGAAVVAIVAAMGTAGAINFSGPREAVYATAVGGHETVPLADGSQIELNTDTTLRVSETGSQRIVKLEKGDAYFNVKHDNARPFMVVAGRNRIVDLGTRFEIRSEGSALQVALLEGRARLESTRPWMQTHAMLLKPGDVAWVTADTVSLQKHSSEQLTNALGWRRGVLVFEHATLADAVEEFNRYNSQRLVVVDPAVGRLKIDATLPVNGIDGFVRVAQDVLGVRVSHQGSAIVISR